jgi:pimeloyl-ACP methyl ester carboxylesterase
VHGFAGSGRLTWADNGWLDLLADDGRDARTIDLLGHGEAPKPHDPAAYAALADHLAAELPDEQVDAIGFSLGGQTLLRVAAGAPDRFRRLVVAGVGDDVFGPPDPEPVAQLLEAGSGLPDEPFLRHLLDLASSPGADREALAACMRRPRRPLTDDELGALDRPVLVVLGERDHAAPADRLVEALPDAELVVLRGVDHSGTPRAMAFLDAALRFVAA